MDKVPIDNKDIENFKRKYLVRFQKIVNDPYWSCPYEKNGFYMYKSHQEMINLMKDFAQENFSRNTNPHLPTIKPVEPGVKQMLNIKTGSVKSKHIWDLFKAYLIQSKHSRELGHMVNKGNCQQDHQTIQAIIKKAKEITTKRMQNLSKEEKAKRKKKMNGWYLKDANEHNLFVKFANSNHNTKNLKMKMVYGITGSALNPSQIHEVMENPIEYGIKLKDAFETFKNSQSATPKVGGKKTRRRRKKKFKRKKTRKKRNRKRKTKKRRRKKRKKRSRKY